MISSFSNLFDFFIVLNFLQVGSNNKIWHIKYFLRDICFFRYFIHLWYNLLVSYIYFGFQLGRKSGNNTFLLLPSLMFIQIHINFIIIINLTVTVCSIMTQYCCVSVPRDYWYRNKGMKSKICRCHIISFVSVPFFYCAIWSVCAYQFFSGASPQLLSFDLNK